MKAARTSSVLVAVLLMVLATGVARATTPNTVYLYTSDSATCHSIGYAGTADGVFDSFECRLGIAGYNLLVEPSHSPLYHVVLAWSRSSVTCDLIGGNGQSGGVWGSYYCRSGIAGYDLVVNR